MLIKLGMIDSRVPEIRARLKAEGFDSGNPGSELFDFRVENMVEDFQDRHIGPDRKFLKSDGIVGDKTWWALTHPIGFEQKSNIGNPLIPDGLTPIRRRVVEIAGIEYRAGVHEVPNGSNQGDGVDKYLVGSPAQWCCASVSWVYHEATGEWPFGVREFSTWNAWQYCINHLQSKKVDDSYSPIPGDFMLIQHKRGKLWKHTGHIAIIVAVDKSGFAFNTIGGNESNRVKLGLRDRNQPGLVSFLNVYSKEEQPVNFERGLISGNRLVGIQTT